MSLVSQVCGLRDYIQTLHILHVPMFTHIVYRFFRLAYLPG